MTAAQSSRLILDGVPTPFAEGDTVLTALLRAGVHPTGGGCLCAAGDCPHCLVTADGVSYVRACQTRTRPGMLVERHHARGYPPLPDDDRPCRAVITRHLHCDVVVIGQGESGVAAAEAARREGKDVITLDANAGQEVIGIYPGPLVVARTDADMLNVHPRDEIVIATGAAEIQPVAPGNSLAGIMTARAASVLARAGMNLGRVIAVGRPPDGIEAKQVDGEIVRFEGGDKVSAVVVRDAHGKEQRHHCDTVAVGLGLSPHDALARMARGLPIKISVVGDAAVEPALPPPPRAGVVCPCSNVSVDDLQSVWDRGFRELELVKRASLAGTGTCQGCACLPHIRSFLQDRGGALQAPFTARPVTRQLTLGEIASGAHHAPTPRTALHDEHLRMGARMTRVGGWWRPWDYGDMLAEYWAVREAVSLGDVSTLGKMLVSGPDALELLERLYPTKVATIKPGRSRYVLLLDDRGYVLDDGLICNDGAGRYLLTFTSGGSTTAELWVRDWAEAWGLNVRFLNQTQSLGAINVTGPLANELMAHAGLTEPLAFMEHRTAMIAGVPCRVYRLSFTGEVSYELHHSAEHSAALWRRLFALGADLGVKPHGIDALLKLRLEKGHILVGQDSDFDSTPRRLNHEWAVKLDKPDFVGKGAILRTNKLPLDKQLVGLEMDGPAPIEGAVVYRGADYGGYVTSSFASPLLGKTVLLAWVKLFGGALPDEVTVSGRVARRVETPFYDPEGTRARASAETSRVLTTHAATTSSLSETREVFARIPGVRIVASPAALDPARWPSDAIALRTAPDEVFVIHKQSNTLKASDFSIADPYAIVLSDGGFAGIWLPLDQALDFLARECEWEVPRERPAFAQGMVAGLAMKLWFEQDRVLLLVPAPFAHELEERLGAKTSRI
jgi:glycine cleavage system aminomethyltransferase T